MLKTSQSQQGESSPKRIRPTGHKTAVTVQKIGAQESTCSLTHHYTHKRERERERLTDGNERIDYIKRFQDSVTNIIN